MSINEAVAAYLAAKEAEKAAAAEAKAMQALILQAAGGEDYLETDDYRVMISERTRCTLDTTALYKDFPDAKDVYGRETKYSVITAKAKAASGNVVRIA